MLIINIDCDWKDHYKKVKTEIELLAVSQTVISLTSFLTSFLNSFLTSDCFPPVEYYQLWGYWLTNCI